MKEVEVKLRAAWIKTELPAKCRIRSFSRSHHLRFTDFPNRMRPALLLIAYASAYLKCHYLAAFTAAMLNNQPMGFYSPATW